MELMKGFLKENEVDVKQLSEEWFDLRLKRITGSKFPDLMKSPKARKDWTDTQISVLMEIASQILTGERKPSFLNDSMQWGIDHESEAKDYYEIEKMTVVRESGFFKIDDNLGDSPDGIIEGEGKVWECKCPNSKTHLEYLLDPEKLFKKYKWQCYGHMWATGLTKGDIVSYDPRFPEGKRMVVYSFESNISDMVEIQSRMSACVKMMLGFVND